MPDRLQPDPLALPLILTDDLYVRPGEKGTDLTQPSPRPAPRPVLVLHEAQLAAEEQTLLAKILEAVKVPAQQYDTHLLPTYQASLAEGRRFILVFAAGQPPRDFAFAERYEAVPVLGQAQLLYADSLAQIAQDTAKKKLLWERLRQLFGV
ncbi:MAG: hypothetical protein MUC97_07465 [Bernardetiaceae bacterium]|jgi:DNA polymerase III psi subunit|nr:hypothetical protein [Bernardetiaceae bacterium]